jgi:hypothetical protein
MAAEMVNALVGKLLEMNEQHIRDQLRRKVHIYNMLYGQLHGDLLAQRAALDSVLGRYRDLIGRMEARGMEADELRRSLAGLTDGLKDKENQMLKVRQLYLLMSNAVEHEEFKSITLMNQAMPDMRSPFKRTLAASGGIALGFCLASLAFIWIYYENREIIRTLLFGKPPAPAAGKPVLEKAASN